MAEEEEQSAIPWAHLVPVPDHYKELGCSIQDTHLRGITIEILEDLANLIENVLKAGYKIVDEHQDDKEIPLEEVNLYHIDKHFVKPLTSHHKCSFAELTAPSNSAVEGEAPLKPIFFVSHWWGTPLVDTIRMLKLHRKKCFEETDSSGLYTVWICAFANNQHTICQDLEIATEGGGTESYRETPFAKAILASGCRGTVLLLNESKATPFTRSWCIFEAFVSLSVCAQDSDGEAMKSSYHRFDILTMIPEGACLNSFRPNVMNGGIANASIEEVKGSNERCAGILLDPESSGTSKKEYGIKFCSDSDVGEGGAFALSWFPGSIAMLGLTVDMRGATATQPQDRKNISNWVGNRYNEVNLELRTRFVRPALKAACMEYNAASLRQIEVCSRPLAEKEDLAKMLDRLETVWYAIQFPPEVLPSDQQLAEFLGAVYDMGCDPNRPVMGRIGPGWRPLGLALRSGKYDLARIFLAAGAEPKLLKTHDLCGIDYSKLPDDIYRAFEEDGILCKAKCRRAFRPILFPFNQCLVAFCLRNSKCLLCWLGCILCRSFWKDLCCVGGPKFCKEAFDSENDESVEFELEEFYDAAEDMLALIN